MGLTKDSFTGKVDGHEVEVQARSGPLAGRFALMVDGEVQDTIKAINGDHWLKGETLGGEGRAGKPFRVRVNIKAAGLGGESYHLEVDGKERPLGKGFIL